MVQAELVDRLQELGLSAYEARTLVDLACLGKGTAKNVANIGDVPRARVYDAVENLHELGLVDIQHTTPKKFTVVSRESIVSKLDVDRQNTITEVAELFAELDPVEPQREQADVWTVTGHDTVAQRVFEFIDEADEEIIYMTVDDLLTDDHLTHLHDADERGVDIHIAGISEAVQTRIQEAAPSAELFETL